MKEYYKKNAETIKEKNKLWRMNNPDMVKAQNIRRRNKYYDNRDHELEAVRKYRERHPDRVIESRKKCYKTNRSKIRAQQAEYAKAHKLEIDARNARNKRRVWSRTTLSRHRQKGYDVEISIDDLHIYAEEATVCAYCGTELDWAPRRGHYCPNSPTLDRVNNGNRLSRRWGGIDDKSEGAVAIVCHLCNTSKQGRSFTEWIAACGYLSSKWGYNPHISPPSPCRVYREGGC